MQSGTALGQGWNSAGTVRTVLVPPGTVQGQPEQSVLPEGSAGRRRVGRRPSRAGRAGRRELPVAPPPTRRGRAAEGLSLSLAFCYSQRRPPRTLAARPRPGPASPRPRPRVRARKGWPAEPARAPRSARPGLATAGRRLSPGSPVTRGCRDPAFKKRPHPAPPPCKST